jgi:hypothetical protein
MSDFTNSVNKHTDTYPVNIKESSGLLDRVEPLTKAAQVISRFLKGVSLTMANGDVINDEDIEDKIMLAINNLELELKIPILAEEFEDRLPFDKDAYKNYIFTKTKKKPIQSVLNFRIETTDGLNIFKIPPQWIDAGKFNRGEVTVVPYLASYTGQVVAGFSGNSGLVMLASLAGINWIPAYFTINYTAGLCKDLSKIPKPLNYLIGLDAALMVFSQLGASIQYNSVSLTQDGIAQSSSSVGNQQYVQRRNDLLEQREKLVQQLKGAYSTKYYSGDL